MKKSGLFLLCLVFLLVSCEQNGEVAETEEAPQATSLLGESLYAPEPTEGQLANYESAKAEYENNPDDKLGADPCLLKL